ncbi:hypothetical protein DFH06DRAFT_1348987, partial [Mycena polygramma]
MDLAEFLSTVWLRSTHIDIMMEDLANRVAADPKLAPKALREVLVAKLSFTHEILRAKKGPYSKNALPELHHCEREVKENGKEKLIFCTNVANKHWVAGEMDFKNRTIGFGDSMPGFFRPPEKLIKGLQNLNWGQQQFGIKFQWDYDALEHGIQRDGFSCGIVAINTAERRLYPDTPLWIPRLAVAARVHRFLKYVKHQKVEPPKDSQSTSTEDNTANLEAVKEPAPAPRSYISIYDLLNPPDDMSAQSVNSSGSSAFSDNDVLLGRATWNDEESESEAAASEHVSFATSSGADGADWDGADWDRTSESAMGGDDAPAGEDEAEAGPATPVDNVASAMDVDVPPDEPVAPTARDGSKSRKATKQTS